MASKVNKSDIGPTLNAARRWIEGCLIDNRSILSAQRLWTPEIVREVREAFVGHPDTGRDRFIVKLRRQMTACSPEAQQLTAEMLWALLLFPSSVGVNRKREQVLEIWSMSGTKLEPEAGDMADDVLSGIGSGGPGFNAHFPKELTFLLEIVTDLKEKSPSDRRKVFSDYANFIDWIDTVPQFGHRQFRHMLRYFAFPDAVERMSSNDHRRKVLKAFDVAETAETRHWSDRQLDEALLDLRKGLERKYPGQVLDFYEIPLSHRWRDETDETKDTNDEQDAPETEPGSASATQAGKPTNLILYGPPGTGKTHWMRGRFADYTDQPDHVDEATWVQGLISTSNWRSIVAASLDHLGGAAKVPEIRRHRWVEEKVRSLGRSANVNHTIWATLQTHTTPSSENVKYANRREPFVFSKDDDGRWRLLADWRELDEDAAELSEVLRTGPRSAARPVQRYRVVTFHPSFSYEDFVRGIRPVATAEDGVAQFRIVDGVFKKLCDEARANPGRRYALFIDEINRANIAKVFGELITLIEVDKRAIYDPSGVLLEGMEVDLPGSQDVDRVDPPFGVPANLDIYATMNTADRSIALLDIALRRRFEFKELEPDYATLDTAVETVHLGRLLSQINDRLEYLLDRDHRVGHAYLMHVASLDELRGAFARKVIPLLQEYFFDDFSKIALVLETAAGDAPILAEQKLAYSTIFASRHSPGVPAERSRHVLTSPSTWSSATFRGIYDSRVASDEPSV